LRDWRIDAGQVVIFNSAQSWITTGVLTVQAGNPQFPNDPLNPPTASFLPTHYEQIRGGVVHVRHFFIEQGGVLKLEGPNAFELIASGEVWIRGKLIADGADAPEPPVFGGIFRGPLDLVIGSNPPTAFPVPGGVGHAGGGNGGASEYGAVVEASGGAGEGAFGSS
jgi:hypothetical protein